MKSTVWKMKVGNNPYKMNIVLLSGFVITDVPKPHMSDEEPRATMMEQEEADHITNT